MRVQTKPFTLLQITATAINEDGRRICLESKKYPVAELENLSKKELADILCRDVPSIKRDKLNENLIETTGYILVD